jgi:hypothetical protein
MLSKKPISWGRVGNHRIEVEGFLNRYYAFGRLIESMLRARRPKFFFDSIDPSRTSRRLSVDSSKNCAFRAPVLHFIKLISCHPSIGPAVQLSPGNGVTLTLATSPSWRDGSK